MKKRFLYSVHRHCLQLLLLFAGAVAHAQSPGWAVDPAAYQYGMTMVAQIRIDDVPNHQTNNHLAVFSQGQIRGYATPVIFSGQAYYFLNLYSKAYKGDTLYFRAFIGADGKVYESTDTVIFKHHLALGTIGEPFQVHLNLGDRPLIYTLLEVDYEANTCPEVLDIQSTDQQNSEGNGLIYSITGGADAARFSINPQTGLLSWLNFNPDFTMPSDADGDNRYEVQVKVQDASGLFDEQYITVQVVEGLPLPPLLCPDDLTIHTSDDGTGDCGATSDQTGIPLSGPCAANLFQYELNGATAGGGTGLVPPGQVFARGLTTVVYIRIAGGGNSECAFTVLVEDDEMPTITCPDDVTLAPDITNPCGAEADGINAEFTDNCSGAGISYELEGATTGSGSGQAAGQIFPTGVTTVTYTVTDGADHYSDCTFTVTVTNCNTEFSGTILWEHDGTSGVQNTTVNLTGSATGSDLSDVNGDYLISLPYQTGNFTLKPVKNLNKLNGVTTADVTAIQQHVGNASLLPAPFKRIAADVNKSNSITSVDATLLNQALLGNQSALNQITSWRFVPASYTFPNPDVPWGFPEQIDYTNVGGNINNQDFKGIKLGDVVSTWANPANFGGAEALIWRVSDEVLESGSEITATFRADQTSDLTSFQFALYFDPAQLQLLEIEPIEGQPLTMDHFGTYKVSEGEIRVVWAQGKALLLGEATAVFRLRFTALQSGARLSEVLQLNGAALPGLCYNSVFSESEVELHFSEWTTGTGSPADKQEVQLFQNQPNPFEGYTRIGFLLPQPCDVQLRVFDSSGRVLAEYRGHYPAGKHDQILDLNGASGVLYYELITPFGISAKKMTAR